MAVPTTEPRTSEPRAPSSRLPLWMRRLGTSGGRPVFAFILAMVVGIIIIMFTSPGSLIDRFNQAIAGYQALFAGSFGGLVSISYTLVYVTPLILTSLSVAIAFRAGLFNIGAEGQLAVGAMTAGIIAFKAPHLSGWVLIPLMIIGSMLAGAIWGGIVGFLKAWRGAHEVVTTIMLNWIAFYFTDYLINGPFKAPFEANQTDAVPLQARLPLVAVFYNSTLGTFLPKIATPQQYFVDMGIFFALLALVVYWFLISRTTFGYEIRVLGQNQKAARYAGIPIKRNLFVVMAIAGAFSGLAGAIHLMGQSPYQVIGSTFSGDSTGFDAIGVALLGRTTAVGILFASLLFGGLRQGAALMQLNAGIPGDLVYIIQALVLFSIASEFLPAIQRALPKGLLFSRKPALVPAIEGTTVSNLPADGRGPSQKEIEQTELTRGSPGENDPIEHPSHIGDETDRIVDG